MNIKHYLPLDVILLIVNYMEQTDSISYDFEMIVAKSIHRTGYRIPWIFMSSGGHTKKGYKYIELMDGFVGTGFRFLSIADETYVIKRECIEVGPVGKRNKWRHKLLGTVINGDWEEYEMGSTIVREPNTLFETDLRIVKRTKRSNAGENIPSGTSNNP